MVVKVITRLNISIDSQDYIKRVLFLLGWKKADSPRGKCWLFRVLCSSNMSALLVPQQDG